LEQAADGELVLTKEIMPLIDDIYRLEGVVKDLDATVEDLARIIRDKELRLEDKYDQVNGLIIKNESLRTWNIVWRVFNVVLVACIFTMVGMVRGWW
jgi:hypothetical protein